MKITFYELLGLIQNKKIKEGTKIKCSDFPVAYIYKNGTLGFYDKERFYELALKDVLENCYYATYKIIEEQKEIEKLKIGLDTEYKGYTSTERAVRSTVNDCIDKINELIEAVNELRKEGK